MKKIFRIRNAERQLGTVNPAQCAGFTLIEMLVVVIIISILAGMVFGLLKSASNYTKKATTDQNMNKMRGAIESFYAAFGQYPPVPVYFPNTAVPQPFYYEYPNAGGTGGQYLPPACDWANASWSTTPLFTFGLMSFLVPRYTGHADTFLKTYSIAGNNPQWANYNTSQTGDQNNDLNAINRWLPDIQDITWPNSAATILQAYPISETAHNVYTNLAITVCDGWGGELIYQSPPPYQSYKLISKGPDGTFGSPDDIVTGAGY